MRGRLGWANPGSNSLSSLDVYGPGDRFAHPADREDPPCGGRNGQGGDGLADALVRAGGHEGAVILVIAVDRFGDSAVLDDVESFLAVRQGLIDMRPDELANMMRRRLSVIDGPVRD
jgi:hypothetical protein